MEQVCGENNIINYKDFIGSGTHGFVYGSFINKNIAIKLYKSTHCNQIQNNEYTIQEIVYDYFKTNLHIVPTELQCLIKLPYVYGFKYLPNSINHTCCMYYMDRLLPLNDYIIQLSFNYDRDYDDILSSGRYVGIDTLLKFGFESYDISLINRCMATMMALFHFGLKMDAYDIEFVLIKNDSCYQIAAIDYDKVNYYEEKYPYNIRRKLTENDYDDRLISNQNDLIKLLATTIIYCPNKNYIEYIEWKETYIQMAKYYKKNKLATLIMNQYEKYL